MNKKYTIIIFIFSISILGCRETARETKGFAVRVADSDTTLKEKGIVLDSLKFETRPSTVLISSLPNVRLSPIYKVNINKNDQSKYIGSSAHHYNYSAHAESFGNNWNNNIMPGIDAIYGFNMVNVSFFNIQKQTQKLLFEKPVLIRTLYYPAYSRDTLNNKPIFRNYIIISAYDDDTNQDGYINIKDLRRIFLFDANGDRIKALVPENYAVIKSEYDPGNDYMYIFGQLDQNSNGIQDQDEPIHIFWVDLKNPLNGGQVY